ncbi:hypothetical protein HTV45_32190 [Streptomyces sp. CHD11]|uniref:hypothetical protein n=1 Tax=Streptomyces sp. CHD11 TaxID=2741325 RepID=UPI001BFC5D4B|nr:hypothetical protein [Streptomyces sp. CHD11]MBT3155448.1 hypothetical protein [Streptomyces sp. CHD11]
MSGDEGHRSGSVTVLCCVASWKDWRLTRRSLVVLPSQGERPASYAARRLRPHKQLAWHERQGFGYWGRENSPSDAGIQLRAMSEAVRWRKELQDLRISPTVEIEADEESVAAWTEAVDEFLRAKDRAEDRLARSLERTRRRGIVRPNTLKYRRFERRMASAERAYQQAVGDLPTRVQPEIDKAQRAAHYRQLTFQSEISRRTQQRQQAINVVDRARVWRILVQDETAYMKRSDVEPTTTLPGDDEAWSEPLTIDDLARRLAPLLYQRSMVAPKIWYTVWDDAAADATQSELEPLGLGLSKWWLEHYRPAASSVADGETRPRYGGYSSGGFV